MQFDHTALMADLVFYYFSFEIEDMVSVSGLLQKIMLTALFSDHY